MDQRAFKWFGRMDRINEHQIAKKAVDGGSKLTSNAGKTEVRLDGGWEGGLE